MTVTATPYSAFPQDLGAAVHNFSSDTDKVALLANTYTPDFDAHISFADVVSAEITGAGYTAGGIALSGVTWTFDAGARISTLNADPVLWSDLAATTRYAVVYKSTGTDSTSRLIGLFDFGADRTYATEPFQLSFPNGVVRLTVA